MPKGLDAQRLSKAKFPSNWVIPFLEARSGGSTRHCKPLVLRYLGVIRCQPMTYETLRFELWIGHGLDFVILFFTIIFCFLHPLTIHYKQVRNIIRIDSIIVYILFLTVNLFYATIH